MSILNPSPSQFIPPPPPLPPLLDVSFLVLIDGSPRHRMVKSTMIVRALNELYDTAIRAHERFSGAQ